MRARSTEEMDGGRRALLLAALATALGARARAAGTDPRPVRFAVATHFPDWPRWDDAYRVPLDRPEARQVALFAVSAGRPDWTFFRWPDARDNWSDTQAEAADDMLETAVAAFAASGHETSAVLDVLAPRYIRRHPGHAARDHDGAPSSEIVCSTVLAEGPFGDLLERCCDALAASTRADSICLTELFYDDHCFCDRCLEAFRRTSGARDWPRRRGGGIDWRDRTVARWRSAQVAAAVRRVAAAVRRRRKRFLMDVRVSREDPARYGVENGQDYQLLAPLADQLIAWDYFALGRTGPGASRGVARRLTRYLGAERYWHSIGLWARGGRDLPPPLFRKAVAAAVAGGARDIWVTPARRLSDEHWRTLAALGGARRA